MRKLWCAIGYVSNREKSQSLIRENLFSGKIVVSILQNLIPMKKENSLTHHWIRLINHWKNIANRTFNLPLPHSRENKYFFDNKHSRKLISYVSHFKVHYSDFNRFVSNAPFLYSLKTSQNRKIFWCFQGLEKECIGNVWVKNCLELSKRLIRRKNQVYWKNLLV